MKKLLSRTLIPLLIVALSLPSLTGCAMLKKNVTPETLQLTLQTVAQTGASVRLANHPEDAPRFALAVGALNLLLADGQFSAADLQAALATLPVNELKGDTGTLIIDAAVVVYQLATGGKSPIESAPYVVAAATGIRDGLKAALPTGTVVPAMHSDPSAQVAGAPVNLLATVPKTVYLRSDQAIVINRITYWNGTFPCHDISGATQMSKVLWLIPPGARLQVGTVTVVGVK